MKQLVLILCFSLLFISCDLDDSENGPFYISEAVSIESVILPDEFIFGETYNIILNFSIPNDCYFFDSLFMARDGNEITIAVVNNVLTNRTCTDYVNGEVAAASFDLVVDNRGSFVFKFWKGKDINGEDIYYEVEVPVTG